MQKWIFSGEQLREISENNLYHSPKVNEYLGSERKLLLLSSKGMGKTHLLRKKRAELSNSAKGRSAVFIPRSSGSDVDRQSTLPMNKGPKFWGQIKQVDWAILWEISIALSVLINIDQSVENERSDYVLRLVDIADNEDIPNEVSELIFQRLEGENPKLANPTFILNCLLSLESTPRQRLMSVVQNLVLQLYSNYVSSAVYVFIDSFDQTLSDTLIGEIDLWVNGQTGLAIAAYNIFVNCNHIRVFTSIRQEAWNHFEHENKQVIESFSTRLEYSKQELKGLINHLAHHYEGVANLDGFLGTAKKGVVRNFGVCEATGEYLEEQAFEYLFRHSLGTPRSLLNLMSSVSSECDRSLAPDKYEKLLRKEVNLKSGTIAETKIESEMAHFLRFLDSKERRARFFSLIHGNILSLNELKRISDTLEFDGSAAHPFCELYNLGLLGVLKRDTDGDIIQHFKSPLEFDWRLEGCLPRSKYFLLHPSFEAFLSNTYRLDVEPSVIVSDGADWPASWDAEISRRTVKLFVSYSRKDRELRDAVISSVSLVLGKEGIRHEYWIDDHEIEGGDSINGEISRGIEWSDFMISLITENYLSSPWCMSEFEAMHVEQLNGEQKTLLPFLFDGVERERLGALMNGKSTPEIEDYEPSSLIKIGHAIRKHSMKWRKGN
ncbi:toll/interleukin-1 receptor domain-containing protein [Aliiroseovarius sp. F20344]|uniref:toll/interleukin-1 receptor domain-containing protein n=1 Tax=Aliiroseovarius sp. F20344 TaxID=2926414 RepID=UPI001FF329B2|nr:toll/interleukin-1 receptor domain-containing protein [Aliiroseovarius sp. F20344]MCK0142998.1 toll/interleukin-1 receptor domain-containing protein [Aliiroseovarius sp. F20344]